MNTYITKNQTVPGKPISHGRRNQNHISTMVGNRTEAAQGNRLQDLMAHSLQTFQAAQLQAMADEYTIRQPISHVPVIQRKVYVGPEGQEVRKEPVAEEDPAYDEALNQMITDDVHRHFLNEDELIRFKNRKFGDTSIDYIGSLFSAHLGSAKPWIRIDPSKLTILGENHAQTTLTDVARALQTKRFMYEPIEKIPFKITNWVAGVASSKEGKNKNILSGRVAHPLPGEINPLDHHLETSYRRYAYGLALVDENIAKSQSLLSGDALKGLDSLFEMLRIAKVIAHLPTLFLTRSERAIKQAWNKRDNGTNWKSLMTRLEGGEYIGFVLEEGRISKGLLQPMIKALINYTIDQLGTYGHWTSFLQGEVMDDRLKKPHLKNMLQSNYHETFKHSIDSWREDYMWKRIQHAEKNRDKYILIGMGDAHRMNLTGKIRDFNSDQEQRNIARGLDNTGTSIVHDKLDNFIASAQETAKKREARVR